MILLQLLKHSKSFSWYCFFKRGKCYVIYLPERWMDYMYKLSIYSCKSKCPIDQFEKQDNLFEALKYQKNYKKGEFKNEKI